MYSNTLIINILKYIDINIKQKISLDDISKLFNYDKSYIMRLFKKEMGITIIDYLNRMKIYNSLELLKNKNNTFLYVALKSGFYSQEYFSETFKKIMQVTPKDYQNFLFRKLKDDKDINLIIKNSLSILELKEKSNYYQRNKKPTIMVKVKKRY